MHRCVGGKNKFTRLSPDGHAKIPAFALIVVVAGLISSCSSRIDAVRGVADLRGYDFSRDGVVYFAGERDWVEVRVSDNGDGVPVGARDKLFSPFFTTKPAGEGTGLGLSISHDIVVKGHGGALFLDTSTTAGATCVVQVPL